IRRQRLRQRERPEHIAIRRARNAAREGRERVTGDVVGGGGHGRNVGTSAREGNGLLRTRDVALLSVITTLAVRAPRAVGAKVTKIPQELPGARPAPPIGQLLACWKSPELAPERAMLEISNGAVPMLEMVIACCELVVETV